MSYNYFRSSDEYTLQRKDRMDWVTQKVWDFFISDAEKLGFEDRVGQQNMALDITQALEARQHIAVEAGVGIGKSFAYLVPALLYNYEFSKPVAVATSTIALQEQLASDVETVAHILKLSPEVILAKGQTHYVCRKRADEYLKNKDDNLSRAIKDEINRGKHDRRDFKFTVETKMWDSINIKDFGKKACTDCPHKMICRFNMQRNAMKRTSGIILCNQDLLTVHLQKVSNYSAPLLNPEISLVVVDEAHNLEDKVRNAYIRHYSQMQIMSQIRQAIKSVRQHETDIDKLIDKLSSELDKLYRQFQWQIKQQIERNLCLTDKVC